jgi:hypothetical protein
LLFFKPSRVCCSFCCPLLPHRQIYWNRSSSRCVICPGTKIHITQSETYTTYLLPARPRTLFVPIQQQ